MKIVKKLCIASFFGVMMLATLAGMPMVKATDPGNAFAVSNGQSWTWKVTKCVWDSVSTTKFVGKGATITITNATNTTSFSTIKGNVTLFNADGSTIQSLPNVVLGSVNITNPTMLAVYANSSNFILPVILPLPLDQTFAAFAKVINSTLAMLKAQYGTQIPFNISKNYTVNAAQISATQSKFSITFNVTGGVSTYTVTNQPVELSILVDGHGVVTDYTAVAKGISIGSGIKVDVTLFEIAFPGTSPSSTPGYSEAILLLGAAAAISVVAVKIKRRN